MVNFLASSSYVKIFYNWIHNILHLWLWEVAGKLKLPCPLWFTYSSVNPLIDQQKQFLALLSSIPSVLPALPGPVLLPPWTGGPARGLAGVLHHGLCLRRRGGGREVWQLRCGPGTLQVSPASLATSQSNVWASMRPRQPSGCWIAKKR